MLTSITTRAMEVEMAKKADQFYICRPPTKNIVGKLGGRNSFHALVDGWGPTLSTLIRNSNSMDIENIVKLFAAYLGCNADVAEGQVNFHLEGKGALDSRLVDLEVSMNGEDSVLKPLRDAYFAANNMEAPPLSLTVETADNYEVNKLRTALKSLEPSESAE